MDCLTYGTGCNLGDGYDSQFDRIVKFDGGPKDVREEKCFDCRLTVQSISDDDKKTDVTFYVS